MLTHNTESLLCELIKKALWNKELNCENFALLSDDAWKKIVSLASAQGVLAIVYDAVICLPAQYQPSKAVKLSWAINVDAVEKRYARQQKACANLEKLYNKHNIKVMLMKGFGLAQSYPVPNHRDCGDLDIWLFGDAKNGNEIVERQNIKVLKDNNKHSNFYFENIPVENHATFLDVDQLKIDKKLEQRLHQAIEQGNLSELKLSDSIIYLPTPMFNALFLARHMIVHLVEGIGIRHLCDWAIFLDKFHGQYDKDFFIDSFKEVNILPVVHILTELAIDVVGLDPFLSPFETPADQELKAKILEDMLYPIKKPKDLSLIGVICYKFKNIRKTQWKNMIANNETFVQHIWRSVYLKVLAPASFFRMKI